MSYAVIINEAPVRTVMCADADECMQVVQAEGLLVAEGTTLIMVRLASGTIVPVATWAKGKRGLRRGKTGRPGPWRIAWDSAEPMTARQLAAAAFVQEAGLMRSTSEAAPLTPDELERTVIGMPRLLRDGLECLLARQPAEGDRLLQTLRSAS